MVTLKKIGEKEPVHSSGTVTLKKIQAEAQAAPQPVGNSGVTLKKIESTNHMPTLQVERANEQDKLLVPSVSRQAAQNTPNVVKGNFTGDRQTAYTPKFSAGKLVAGTVEKGLNEFSQGIGATGAALEKIIYSPLDLVTGEKFGTAAQEHGIFTKTRENDRQTGERLRQKYAANVAAGGKAAELVDKYGTMTVATIPDALLAIATGGGSAAPEIGKTVQSAAYKIAASYGKNPQFWTSLARVFGTSYEQAKADGASEADAYAYAVGNGMFNAAIEVGGGIQTLPGELQNESVWRAIGKTMVEEAGEEVTQGIVERGAQNIVYGKNNPLFSVTDESAVLNPRTATEEAIGGAVVGGLLGGGEIGAVNAINAVVGRASNAATVRAEATEGNLTGMAQNAPQGAAEGAVMPKAKGLRELEEAKGWNGEAAAGVTLKKVQPTDHAAYETAKKLGNLTGKKVAWFTETADGTGGTKNGFYDRSTNTIWLNTESGDPVAKIFSHELTHAIEQSEQYESFKKLVFDRKAELGENIEAQRNAKRALYERHGVNLQSEAEIDSEILAEYVENNLLTNEKEIRRICQTNRSIGQSVLDWINKQLAKLGFRDAKERVYLENVKQLYAEALAESNRTSQRDLDEARAELFESLQRGEITQEEYDDAAEGMDIGQEAMGGVQFSIKRTSEMTLAEQLKAFYDGKLASSDAFYFGETPEALESAGLDKLPLAITTSDFKKSAKEKHNVPRRVWNNLQKDLETAPFAFEDGDRIGFMTSDIDGDGKPLLIAIQKNVQMDAERVNAVRSAYGLDNPKEWLKNQLNSGKDFVLLNEQRANAILYPYGYLASRKDGIRSMDGTVSQAGENSKREFSVSEDSKDLIFGKTYGMTSNDLAENVYGMTYEEKLRAGMSERNKLPTKAKNALVRNERYATVAIGEKLGVPKAAQREYMTPLVQELSEEYLKTGSVSKETQDRIFETAYENGIVADNAFYEQYKDVKQKLRETRVQISEEDTHDIPDYGTWKKSVFGTLNIVKDGGIPVNVLYEEMADMAPELFPTNVIAPSDMLVKMAEVGKSIKKAEKTLEEYYGKDAEEYKRWMRNDFDAAVNRQLSELKTIKAYAEDKNNKIRGPKQITTQEELKDAYMTLKDARRAYEKVNNKALLTDSDKAKVGQLLRGEITLEALNPETDNVKDIKAVYEAKKPYEEVTRVIRDYNKQRKAGLRDVADLFLQTANDWKDKKAGIAYSRETMERNVRDIVPDKELADAIVDTYFKPVHDAQAASTRMKNEFRDRIRKLDLSRKIDEKGGNCVSEAYAVQLYGEAMDNIKMLENSRGKLKMRDGKTLADWQGVVTDLWKENPALDRGKVEMAVEEFRDAYDELFEKMNETRLRNGYEPINYRKGYFPHFQPQQSDGLLGLFGKAIGLQTEVTALPTSINGITHMFKPGIQWFGNAQERLGFSTAYDAVEGFDRYIEGAADVIYQTDNIQKLRALASQVRYRTSDEGIQKQVDEVMASDKLSEEEKKDVIDAIYENGRFKLSNFAVELDEYTNILANKKSKADRSMEQMLGRNMYNVVKAFESRVAANMVAVNPASWLTNFIPITQAWGAVDSRYILSGMWGTLKNYRTSDGMKEVSTFLTNREGSEPLVRTKAQEWSAELSKPMEWIDQFTAGSIVRARFLQNTDRGMSAAEAISDADAFAASVMADRSKGSMPTLFHQSNPLMKALTQFQLEQNNQLSYVFKDLPRDKREEGVKRLAAALLKFFLGAYLYNNVYEFFIGRRPALDPIGILNDSVGDWTGYELPSVAEAIDGMANGERFSEQFRTEKKGRVSALGGAAERTLEELPFVGGLLGGGRVPISSALPDWKNLGKAVFGEDMNAKKRLSTIVKELTGPASYIVLPFGGGQIKKIAQGEYATVRGGSYTVDSKGREVLQYPVYTDTEADIFKNVFVTGLFGKTATKEGQAWIESGFKNLSANETQAYKDMREFETQKKAYALIKETKAVGREAGYKEEVAKILLGSGVNGDAKAELFYNVYAADGEKEKIDAMTEAGATRWEATKMILESKTKDASLETLMMSSKDLTDAEKVEIFLNKFATETQKDAYERYGKSISKTTYYKFISATDGLSSDKDADGKTVKGKSKKDKVLKVINGMDLTVAQKNALYYAAGYKESTLVQDAPWYNLKFRGQD